MQWRRVPWLLRYRYGARAAWRMRRLALELTHLHCTVDFQGPVRIGPNFSLDIPANGSFVVGPGVDFRRGFHCEIQRDGRVTIGAGSIFTSNAQLQCTTSIDIGRRCVVAQNVLIADGNHRYGEPGEHLLDQGYDYRPIVIGDGATVFAKCTVVASIGARSVIGANSVVTEDIPPYCLAVGAPARVIRYFGPPEHGPDGLDLDTAR